MEVEQVAGPDAFLERAGELILADEARHNLALGILATARGAPRALPRVDGWVVRDGGCVVGRRSGRRRTTSCSCGRRDDRALSLLADAIEGELPGVVGAVPEVDPSPPPGRRSVTALDTRFEQGVYALARVTAPDA